MSFTLHYAPDNASLIVRLVLEELGAAYRTQLVDRGTEAQKSAAYRKVAPTGLIPALETPDAVIFETGAIVLWLADAYNDLAPASNDPARGDFLKWLFFMSNTLHTGMRTLFYPRAYVGADAGAQRRLRAHMAGPNDTDMTVPRALSVLDAVWAARPGPLYGGSAPWVLDCYLAPILRWSQIYVPQEAGTINLQDYPALIRMAEAMEARRSVQKVARAEGLGPHPFTAPQLPQPPEGSAL